MSKYVYFTVLCGTFLHAIPCQCLHALLLERECSTPLRFYWLYAIKL